MPAEVLTLPSLLQGSSRDDTELRYSSQYEERLDPFSSFSRKVRAALGTLPPHQPLQHQTLPDSHPSNQPFEPQTQLLVLCACRSASAST